MTVYIGLGSNLGNRVKVIGKTVEALKALERTNVTAVSSLYETSPVQTEGGSFLNAVVAAETGLAPKVLLHTLLDLETALGRIRKPGLSGARIVDLDLLLYGGLMMEDKGLTIPHPRMLQRRFVMEPLSELAPDVKIPPTGITATVAARELMKSKPRQRVEKLGTLEEVKESLKFDV